MDRKIHQKTTFHFTDSAKHQIIQELLTTGCSKQEIWKKYTGRSKEHGKIVLWMSQLGYNSENSIRRVNFEPQTSTMVKKKAVKKVESESSEDNFENLQLKKRIAELEKQLKDTELKAIAFSTMIDIAEKEFKIPIRKKYNTKP